MKTGQDEEYLFTLSIFVPETKQIRSRFLWCQCMRILACMSMNKSPHDIVGISGEAKIESS
jgi:hypothetical protein